MPAATQSPPANTFGSDVRKFSSTAIRPSFSASAPPSAAGANSWPIAFSTMSASIVNVSPLPSSLPFAASRVYSNSTADTTPFVATRRFGAAQWMTLTPCDFA